MLGMEGMLGIEGMLGTLHDVSPKRASDRIVL